MLESTEAYREIEESLKAAKDKKTKDEELYLMTALLQNKIWTHFNRQKRKTF